MANYGDDVMKNVMDENRKKEAEAYGSISQMDKASSHLAALLAIGHAEAIKLINAAKDAGCEDALHEYAKYMFKAGFNMGYEKGRLSMLEDTK